MLLNAENRGNNSPKQYQANNGNYHLCRLYFHVVMRLTITLSAMIVNSLTVQKMNNKRNFL